MSISTMSSDRDARAATQRDARNAADQAGLERIQAVGHALEMSARELMPRLRYIDPAWPTDVEVKLIPALHQAFPELMASFESYQKKPTGCGCAGKLLSAITQNIERVQAVFDQVFGHSIYKIVSIIPQPAPSLTIAQTLIGTTVVIDASTDAWTAYFGQLIKTHGRNSAMMTKQLYNGVHVRDIDDGRRWLLLFY